MNAVVQNEQGKAVPLFMGCYGIGVTRVVAAAIEQNHDDKGIIWPTAIAPYHVALLPMNVHKSTRLREAVEALYCDLQAAGIEVLQDDRAVRPGVKFADSELIGLPYRVVMSDRGLDEGNRRVPTPYGDRQHRHSDCRSGAGASRPDRPGHRPPGLTQQIQCLEWQGAAGRPLATVSGILTLSLVQTGSPAENTRRSA